MVFTAPIFLFCFLPLVLVGYFSIGRRYKNAILLLFSLAFYAWGEGIYLIVMLYCIGVSWLFGLWVENAPTAVTRKRSLWLGCGFLVAPLLVFKYLAFALGNLASASAGYIPAIEPLHLPIGISFFTFQALSYLIDIYRSKGVAQSSLTQVGLYISLFPQLIAGPIVRYNQIREQLLSRVITIPVFASGIERFIYGLAKKVLIANPLGYIADTVFSIPAAEMGIATAWIGITCYALQIYFDFSGYSDMAIGLGRMFGFNFPENFNYPYISRSIREFWRRWHISLSSWFRDYIYIPLGGNRASGFHTGRNLLIVFFLCGFWHGASWNFIIWGLLHGSFLVLERGRYGQILQTAPAWLQHFYTLMIVLIAWVFFRSNNLSEAWLYLTEMFRFTGSYQLSPILVISMDRQFWFALIIGCLISTPLWARCYGSLNQHVTWQTQSRLSGWLKTGLLGLLFVFCLFEIAAGAYNPFIYFRF